MFVWFPEVPQLSFRIKRGVKFKAAGVEGRWRGEKGCSGGELGRGDCVPKASPAGGAIEYLAAATVTSLQVLQWEAPQYTRAWLFSKCRSAVCVIMRRRCRGINLVHLDNLSGVFGEGLSPFLRCYL